MLDFTNFSSAPDSIASIPARESDTAVARLLARRNRRIGTRSLLAMFLEDYQAGDEAAETALLRKLSSLKEISSDTEMILIAKWKEQGCEETRDRLILSMMARQLRYLLKKKNVGFDILDILHDAVVEVLGRLPSGSIGKTEKLSTAALLAALRARSHRYMTMHRQLAWRIGVKQRMAMNAALAFDVESIVNGDLTPEDLAAAPSAVPRPIDMIRDTCEYLATSDVNAEDALSSESHEDGVINAIDARHLAPAIEHALDDRARDIMQRRWLSSDREDAADIAADWDITPERVRQIERQSLKDLRAWIEGGTTSLDILRRRTALAERRREARKPKSMSTVRSAVKGVDLLAAQAAMGELLTTREIAVLEGRYFSEERVRTHREVAFDLGVSASVSCTLETQALDVLRKKFPAHADGAAARF